MDISHTLAPTSDQLDAVDLLGGPQTFTIERVTEGLSAEQPFDVHLREFPRPWRPCKTMRRVLAAAWGTDAKVWAGRRVTLYCDPDVTFGKERVGGIRISHMSDLPGGQVLEVPVLKGRARPGLWTVRPLEESRAPRTPRKAAQVAPADDDGVPEPPASQEQLVGMLRALDVAGVETSERLEFVSAAVGRSITHPADLTQREVGVVIDAARARAEGGE